MRKLTKDCIGRLNDVSLFDVVPEAQGLGMTRECACPRCGETGKNGLNAAGRRQRGWRGLVVVDDPVKRKRFVKCRSCDFKVGGGAINVMMEMRGLGFVDACERLATIGGVSLDYEAEERGFHNPSAAAGVNAGAYGSGIAAASAGAGAAGADVASVAEIPGSGSSEAEGAGVKAGVTAGAVASGRSFDRTDGTGASGRNCDRADWTGAPGEGSFCRRQLAESGLTPEDVMVDVVIGGEDPSGAVRTVERVRVCPFQKGSLDPFTGAISREGDDMLILYYGLDGRRLMTVPAKYRTREVGYTRVRWAVPEDHVSRKSGKAMKYQSIFGSKMAIYFPDRIRRMYQAGERIETLFVQEGEKKAEKATKHGMLSVGIQGIGNIGSEESGLPVELQWLVKACGVKNVVLMFDSDWDGLGNVVTDEPVERRALSFARAALKFKRYVGTLVQCGLYVDIWIGHVKGDDKGVDDLLMGALRGREDLLVPDLDLAMSSHDGEGHHFVCRNVTSWSDGRIMGMWGLNNRDDFFARHRDVLMGLRSFKYFNVFYRVDGEVIVVDSEMGEGKEFWTVSLTEKNEKRVDISLMDMRAFLHSNGWRSRRTEGGKRALCRIEGGVIRKVDEYDARQYVLSYVYRATRDQGVHERFTRSIDSELSLNKLCQLDLLQTMAGVPTAGEQRFFFVDSEVSVDERGVRVDKLTGPVWEENLVGRMFRRERIFEVFEPDGEGSFRIELSRAGEACEFLQYLLRASDMWSGAARSREQESEFWLHVANKVTSIGYLLRDYRDMGENKAVVAMDARMSSVGQSNGRSGKSLVGVALSQFVSQAVIEGPNLENNDQYIFSGVRRTTKNVFIDDIKRDFDFSRFKQRITGALNVNVKQGERFVLEYEESPKFYLTSNHAIDGLDVSCMARIVFMSFGPHYHHGWSPEDEFGHLFFAQWDERQWQLFDNFMVEAVMLYMRSVEGRWGAPNKGVVNPPMWDIERRTLRQEMGEMFLAWAEVYFSAEGSNLNCRVMRKSIYEAYLAEYGIKSTQMTSRSFRDKLVAFCRYMGYHLNAHKRERDAGMSFADFCRARPGRCFIGERDVSGSTEYYTVATTEWLVGG